MIRRKRDLTNTIYLSIRFTITVQLGFFFIACDALWGKKEKNHYYLTCLGKTKDLPKA